MSKECVQNTYGPTPCFREVDLTECSLDFCPVAKMLEGGDDRSAWSLLHTHCVMSESYGAQKDFDDGKREFITVYANTRNPNGPTSKE